MVYYRKAGSSLESHVLCTYLDSPGAERANVLPVHVRVHKRREKTKEPVIETLSGFLRDLQARGGLLLTFLPLRQQVKYLN